MAEQPGKSWVREIIIGVVVAVIAAIVVSRLGLDKPSDAGTPSTPTPESPVPAAQGTAKATGTAILKVERPKQEWGLEPMGIIVNERKLGDVKYGGKGEFPFSVAANGINTLQVTFATSVIDPTYTYERTFSASPNSVTRVQLVFNKVLFGKGSVDINILPD
jgi:hypothetical protein